MPEIRKKNEAMKEPIRSISRSALALFDAMANGDLSSVTCDLALTSEELGQTPREVKMGGKDARLDFRKMRLLRSIEYRVSRGDSCEWTLSPA